MDTDWRFETTQGTEKYNHPFCTGLLRVPMPSTSHSMASASAPHSAAVRTRLSMLGTPRGRETNKLPGQSLGSREPHASARGLRRQLEHLIAARGLIDFALPSLCEPPRGGTCHACAGADSGSFSFCF